MKYIKSCLFIILIFLSTSLNAQVPISLNINIGDSEINGLFGAEINVSRFSLGGGWRPQGSLPYTSEKISSWSTVFTTYSNLRESGIQDINLRFYISGGYASTGFIKLDESELPWHYEPIPSVIFLIGVQSYMFPQFKRLTWKAGIGANFNEAHTQFAFEVIFNFILINNNSSKAYCN